MPGRVKQDPMTDRFLVRVSIMDTQTQRIYGAQRVSKDAFSGIVEAVGSASGEVISKFDAAQ